MLLVNLDYINDYLKDKFIVHKCKDAECLL